MDDHITNDGEHQKLALAVFFNVKGTGSRFARPVSKKKKCGRTETEPSSGKSMEVAEGTLYSAVSGDAKKFECH